MATYLVDTRKGTIKFIWSAGNNTQLSATILDEDEWVVINTPYTYMDAKHPQIAAKLIAQFHDLGPPTNLRELI